MKQASLRLRALPAAALLACASHGSAFAETTITSMLATGSYALDGNPAVNLVSAYPANGSSYVDVLEFPGTGTSGAGLHSYGSTFGQFGSRSSGYGVYSVTGGFSIALNITNDTGTAQNAKFSFYITPGVLSNDLGGYRNTDMPALQFAPMMMMVGDAPPLPPGGTATSMLSGDEFVESSISFDIRKNGGSVWGSSATLRTDAVLGTQFNTSGTNLYGGSGTFRGIAGGAYEVDLGVIGAGETIQLAYDLNTAARGNALGGSEPVVIAEQTLVVPDQWVDFCPGCGYGYGGPVFVPGDTIVIPEHILQPAPSGSQASSGDPFEVTFDGRVEINAFYPQPAMPNGVAPFQLSFTPAVPEPATYGMMALGLGLLGLTKRRRRSA